MSVSGIAEQLISTKAEFHLGLISWIARAASSFPVPVAPVINTEASVGATRSMTEKTFRIAGDWPTSLGWGLALSGLASGSKDLLFGLLDGVGHQPSIAVGVARGMDMGAVLAPKSRIPGSIGFCATSSLRKSGSGVLLS